MKFKTAFGALVALAMSCTQVLAQATLLPPGEQCFQAVAGLNGMVGLLGSITGGSGYVNATYGGVALTGGSGSGATANITVSGGSVTSVAILNPGINYIVGDVLSATAASLGGSGSGFSVPVASTAINSSLAGGTVSYYIPNTLTFKQTWQDAGQTILNTNPVGLDANGCATVYGQGVYRQILKDNLGNTVWDKLTTSTSPQGVFWAGQAGGTPNAITITDSAFALQDGATIQFLALAQNTGPTTISVSGGPAISIVRDASTGPAALSGGEIGPENAPMITYDATYNQFHLVNPATTATTGGTSNLVAPQGYVNLVGQASGDVIQTGDVTSTATIYYSPFTGNAVPIWNGSIFKQVTISEMTATLSSSGSPGNALQDLCIFSNNGVPTLVVGPAWTSAVAGSSTRGTGAGSAQISRLQGIWVNANAITAYSGISSYSIPANQCTIVGTVLIDAAGGTTTAQRSYGQSRRWGVWNFYNRQPLYLKVGDATASWSYNGNSFRPANGNTANSLTVLSGLPEEPYALAYSATLSGSLTTGQTLAGQVALGLNANVGGNYGTLSMAISGSAGLSYEGNPQARYLLPPSLGINTITAYENGLNATATTWLGTEANMLLSASWRG